MTPGKRLKGRKSRRSGRSEWEIIEGLRDGQKFEKVPEKFMGYLSKRKRWPMKGWHKVGGTSPHTLILSLELYKVIEFAHFY